MTNIPPTILSPRSPSIHINHGWWCEDCTDQLMALDQERDRTGEWLEALSNWSSVAGKFAGELLVDIATGIATLFMMLAWILICLHDGFASDARAHEKRLHERDGLKRKSRDDMNRRYNDTLRDRQDVLKQIALEQNLELNHARKKAIELEVLPELEYHLRCHKSA